MKCDCTILVSSCDAYKDILDPFFELLHRFWPNLEYPIFLSTESLEYKNKNFKIKNIHPSKKDCAWTTRIAECLHEVQSDYVLLILDDFFLYDFVDTKAFNNCLNWMKDNPKIASFKSTLLCIKIPLKKSFSNFRKIINITIFFLY